MVISLILQITELFLSILAGFLLVKFHILKSSDSRVLSLVTLYLVMPCMLFYAFQIDFTSEVRNGLIMATFLSLIVHIFLIIAVQLLKRFCGFDEIEQLCVMYSNAGNLIVPIVSSLYGPEYVIYSSGFLIVQMILLWSHARTVISGETQIHVSKIILNPAIIAIIIGLATLLTGIPIPQVILDTTQSIGSMIGPICMIVAGMLIAELKLSDVRRYRRLPLILGLRLLIVPIFVLLILRGLALIFPYKGMEAVYLIVFLASITPTAATVTQFCQVYNKDAGYANAINLTGTLLCIVTMPIMVALYLL